MRGRWFVRHEPRRGNLKSDVSFLKKLRLIGNQNLEEHVFKGAFSKSKNMVGGHFAPGIDGINIRLGNGTTDLSLLPTSRFGVISIDRSIGIEKLRELENAQGQGLTSSN